MPLSVSPSAFARISQLAAQRSVHQAFRWFHLNEGRLLDWQQELVGVPAPPFGEAQRASWLAAQFRTLGLRRVSIDDVGNVIGLLPSGRDDAAPAQTSTGAPPPHAAVVLSAHIDTVFPPGTPIEPQREGTRLVAPGACDNAAGVTGLLAIAAALIDTRTELDCDLLFCGNVGEEGEGDLRGMRHLYLHSPWGMARGAKIAANIVLDGAGTEVAVTEALGSRRFLVTVTGPGGHSWTDAGAPNPIAILSTAIAELTSVELPTEPRTTLNVGTIAGGSSVNAIPEHASARFDLRSTDAEQLIRLEVRMHRALEDAVERANSVQPRAPRGRKRSPARFLVEPIGDRPTGRLSEKSNLYQSLRAVDRHLGIRTEPRIASTDANIPLSLGVPAVSIGAGGDGGGIHTRGEWYDATGRELALKRILLLLLSVAGSCGDEA